MIESSKHQAPSTRETPSTKLQTARGNFHWNLVIGASLELGAWSFFREAPLQTEGNFGGVLSLNPTTLIRASQLCGPLYTQPLTSYDD
jgi:hypothetical protein